MSSVWESSTELAIASHSVAYNSTDAALTDSITAPLSSSDGSSDDESGE
ncbi:hypothetical protein LC608_34625 [Nostoc sp. XA010]|nr:hypothetical protein [Nostoc sp. XA010]MCC5661982.1 hypothetical protein [Nostoc sp. XA010]